MKFLDEPVVGRGVVERRFDIEGANGVIPGIVWTPEGANGSRPLVLVGHGGTGNKRMAYVLSLARRVVRHAGYAVAAIDGPGHGDRAGAAMTGDRTPQPGLPSTFVTQVASAAESMTADWTVTLGELRKIDGVGDGPLGYWGLSMGTMLGAPFVAATPEVRCAVLGLMGSFGEDDPWTTAAAKIECPVLFLTQLDDELVPVDRALSLFGTIGSGDKRLHAHPGVHAAVPREEMEASEAFLTKHLG